jgi:hypothetical protein
MLEGCSIVLHLLGRFAEFDVVSQPGQSGRQDDSRAPRNRMKSQNFRQNIVNWLLFKSIVSRNQSNFHLLEPHHFTDLIVLHLLPNFSEVQE